MKKILVSLVTLMAIANAGYNGYQEGFPNFNKASQYNSSGGWYFDEDEEEKSNGFKDPLAQIEVGFVSDEKDSSLVRDSGLAGSITVRQNMFINNNMYVFGAGVLSYSSVNDSSSNNTDVAQDIFTMTTTTTSDTISDLYGVAKVGAGFQFNPNIRLEGSFFVGMGSKSKITTETTTVEQTITLTDGTTNNTTQAVDYQQEVGVDYNTYGVEIAAAYAKDNIEARAYFATGEVTGNGNSADFVDYGISGKYYITPDFYGVVGWSHFEYNNPINSLTGAYEIKSNDRIAVGIGFNFNME